MSGNMVDIQSPTAEIRRGIKKIEKNILKFEPIRVAWNIHQSATGQLTDCHPAVWPQ